MIIEINWNKLYTGSKKFKKILFEILRGKLRKISQFILQTPSIKLSFFEG